MPFRSLPVVLGASSVLTDWGARGPMVFFESRRIPGSPDIFFRKKIPRMTREVDPRIFSSERKLLRMTRKRMKSKTVEDDKGGGSPAPFHKNENHEDGRET